MPILKALLGNEFDQCSIDGLVSSPRKLWLSINVQFCFFFFAFSLIPFFKVKNIMCKSINVIMINSKGYSEVS